MILTQQRKPTLLHWLYISLFAVLIFGFAYLPFQDFPILLYEGFVFNQYVFHANTFGGFFQLYHYLPPNAVSTVVMGIMDILIDPEISGKIYLFFLAVALYTGIVRYLTFHLGQRKPSFASVAFFLTLYLHFITAYLNFVTGLAIALHAIVWIRQYKYESKFFIIAATIFLLYVCHFAALSLFALYFLINLVSRKAYSTLTRFVAAGIPTLAVFIHYLIFRTIPIVAQGEDYRTIYHIIRGKFLVFFSPVIPFHEFKWVTPLPRPLLVANYAFCAILFASIIYVFIKNIRSRNFSFEFWLGLTTLCLAFFLPLYFGGVLLPGERFVLFCLVNIFILGFRSFQNRNIRMASSIVCVLLGASTYFYAIYNTAIFGRMIGAGDIPSEAILHPEWKQEGTNGFLHFHYYNDIASKKPVRVFEVGLFAQPDSSGH